MIEATILTNQLFSEMTYVYWFLETKIFSSDTPYKIQKLLCIRDFLFQTCNLQQKGIFKNNNKIAN